MVFWIAPRLTSRTRTAGVTFHFLLATGKRSIPQRGWLPSPLPHRHHSSTSANVVDSSYRVNRWSHSKSDAHSHSNKTPTSHIHNHSKMESCAPDLLLSFNLLDDIPLVSNTLDFQGVFYASVPHKTSPFLRRKSNWNCRQEAAYSVMIMKTDSCCK